VGCLDRRRARHIRRSDGAPASPLRHSASRACRTSFAGTPRASRRWAFVASCSAAWRSARRMGRRLRRLERAPAAGVGRGGGL